MKLPNPIGRTLSRASLRPRSGHRGQFVLTIDGDRGTIKLFLTEAEVREHLLRADVSDRIPLTLQLEAGTVAQMLQKNNIAERRES